jgi:hypothetical protein
MAYETELNVLLFFVIINGLHNIVRSLIHDIEACNFLFSHKRAKAYRADLLCFDLGQEVFETQYQ